jgi:hypothetical protein
MMGGEKEYTLVVEITAWERVALWGFRCVCVAVNGMGVCNA